MFATVLDPNMKKLKFLTAEQRKATYEQVEQLLEGVTASHDEPEHDSEEPPPKKSANVIADFLGDDITDGNDDDETTNEFEEYLKSKLSGSVDTLEWWRTIGVQAYPTLVQLAIRFLGIQATSVPSERAFSTAGLTITKQRASLNPCTADQIIFLNKNLKSTNALMR